LRIECQKQNTRYEATAHVRVLSSLVPRHAIASLAAVLMAVQRSNVRKRGRIDGATLEIEAF
jgi:hypothetical protein